METAVAAAEAVDPDLEARIVEVRPLGDWVPAPGVPPRPNRPAPAAELGAWTHR